MDYFRYQAGTLHAEDVDLQQLAKEYGTPCYVYSAATLERHWRAFDDALSRRPHLICYAVKANSNLAVLALLAKLGSGFDIVSQGELERVLRAGGDPGKVVFSGVGKTEAEMRRALEVGIYCFNVESRSELLRLNQVAAEMDKQASVSIRVNPDVDANTHPYISTGLKENKFGIDVDAALHVYQEAATLSHIKIMGIDCHIGSQLTEISPFMDALERVLKLVEQLKAQGIELHHLDLGGGLGVRYRSESPTEPAQYCQALNAALGDAPYQILLEPGRAIAANAGVLLTTVEYLKTTPVHHFAIVDAAMNDLLRPSLYQAWQEIIPLQPRHDSEALPYDVVGPICETGDFLGKQRHLSICEQDILAVRSAGAYGFVMSSQYNSRPRPPEIMVQGDTARVVRKRETLDDLMVLECI
ncbi:diaminopimelate decarboxylase [Candidatus Venteria ishoeyi]|uniref:diaminopimelate decarboxylase n=1 Tax=Candidatus Venteria ishoeyi TaxID=1899563 RepID=UPI0025A4FA7C|nr:diaminopimelate decarboxylase [Candidatus Venteria ishoeyi]MDM8546640.1 diaminopimelate decarboxylase [Candidatus Venteria ishoeyi]